MPSFGQAENLVENGSVPMVARAPHHPIETLAMTVTAIHIVFLDSFKTHFQLIF
jgi:hypothetical protein